MNYQNNIIGILLLFLSCTVSGTAQQLLNGDFENNGMLFHGCWFNVQPSIFRNFMYDMSFFSNGVDVDILSHSDSTNCIPAFINPQNGDYLLGIGHIGYDVETLVMRLDQPLSIGRTYELSFWMYREKANPDSLLIGITDDTLSFGTQILASHRLTIWRTWRQEVVQFTPTFNATNITVSLNNTNSALAYYGIDNFVLTDITPTSMDQVLKEEIHLYPNPAKDKIHLSTTAEFTNIQLELYDIQGRKCLSLEKENLTYQTIDVENLAIGVYYLRISSSNKSKTLKFIKG